MKESTRVLRQYKIERLHQLKTNARQQAWKLEKDGYIVEFFERYKKRKDKLYGLNIYDNEKISIYELHGNKWDKIINDMDYGLLTRFYKSVCKYKKQYGKKKIHEYTTEIIKELDAYNMNKYACRNKENNE